MNLREPPIRYYMLTVVEHIGGRYRCVCDCGKERIVNVGHFNAGGAKSCGCHKNFHGHARGTGHSREYQAWANMKARCLNPKNKRFDDYGAKGVTVCDRWLKFGAFLSDMGLCPPGYTIEREDTRLGYSPDNCHWASRQEQQRNRLVSRRWIVNGVEYTTLDDAANELGVSTATVRAWCIGRVAAGRHYPPRPNCSAVAVYPEHDRAAA